MLRNSRIAALLVLLIALVPAQARITKIEIQSTSEPAADGYVTITGVAFGEVDPTHPLNSIIQDIELAPRNERGMVEYSTEFTVLRPSEGGNGLLFYEVVNRGFPMTAFYFPSMANLARQRGYTIVWSGWQGDLVPNPNPLQHTMQVPVATQNGAEITGRIRTEYTVSSPTSTLDLSGPPPAPFMRHQSYEPVDLSGADAILTRRDRQAAPLVEVPNEDWAYADCTSTPFPGVPSSSSICLKEGFDPDHIYELTYTAKNPMVLGLGFAATRDIVSFLRHAATDDFGTPNPVADTPQAAVMQGPSQSSAFVRAFLHLGFNEDETGRIVFEGMNPHIGPMRHVLNSRFPHTGSGNPSPPPQYSSPFTLMPSYDSLAERVGWIQQRCMESNTCPKIVQTLSAAEYWWARASLNTTDALGRYNEWIPRNARLYVFAGTQHAPAETSICQQPANPNDYRPHLRALILALERWVLEDVEPPPSQFPTLSEGTLVPSDKASIGWPDIPGVKYTGQMAALTLADFGPEFRPEDVSGIISEPSTVLTGKDYAVLVPKVDADGNDIAGIRSTAVQAPVATYTGWNLRRSGYMEDDLCGNFGSYIPFAVTKAEREAAGDPRLSLEERYGDHEGYVAAVREAADRLVDQRFLLPEDAAAIIGQAEVSDVLVLPNQAPVAKISPADQTVAFVEAVLDGSASYDPDGDLISYAWSVTGRAAALFGADTAIATVQFQDGTGEYKFVLTVTDDEGATGTATASVLYLGP